MKKASNILIVSINSDIAREMAKKWASDGHRVIGTTTSGTLAIDGVSPNHIHMVNLLDAESIETFCDFLTRDIGKLDAVVFATGTQVPVGKFYDTEFEDWAQSVDVNSLAQLRVLHHLQNILEPVASVLFFAGAGSNSAPPYYSAYISAKLHLTKMVELLSVENPSRNYAIIGPGWVKTKIHDATVTAGETMAGENYAKTKNMLRDDKGFTSVEQIIRAFEWVMNQEVRVTSAKLVSRSASNTQPARAPSQQTVFGATTAWKATISIREWYQWR